MERKQFVYVDIFVQIIFPFPMKILTTVAYILTH